MQAKKDKVTSPIVAIVKLEDAELVKTAIHEKYGFWPTDEYARDLIAFVEMLAQEMVG